MEKAALTLADLVGITLAVAVGVFLGVTAFALWGPDALNLIRQG